MRKDQKKWWETQRKARLKYMKSLRTRKRKRKKVRISKLTGKPLRSRQWLERELWRVFSIYIRKRDGRCVLASLGGCHGVLQAGHVIGRKKLPTKYDENNVFGQCRGHNYLHRYHPQHYYNWYIQEYGADAFDMLVKKSEEPGKVLSIKELEKKIAEYKEKVLD